MNFYVASRLENYKSVQILTKELESIGWHNTYDWTKHGSVRGMGEVVMSQTALNEYIGVLNADIVIALLPGGRGTHVEIGLAYALKKRIILHSDDPRTFDHISDECISFYWLPYLNRCRCSFNNFIECLKEHNQNNKIRFINLN